MLKNLFKPKWQSTNPHTRAQGVSQLNPALGDDLQIIEDLAKSDPAVEVRRAALHHCVNVEICLTAMAEENDANIREIAMSRTRQLLALKTNPTLDQNVALKHLEQINNAEVLAFVAREAELEALRQAAVDNCNDETTLCDVAIHDPVTRVRQKAADKISAYDPLTRVYKANKGKDAKVARIVKNKLDQISADQQAIVDHQAQLQEQLSRLEHLCKKDFSGRYQQALQVKHKWQQLGGTENAQLNKTFEELFTQIPEEKTTETPAAPSISQFHHELEDLVHQWQNGDTSAELMTSTQALLEKTQGQTLPSLEKTQRNYLRNWLPAGQALNNKAETIEKLASNSRSLEHVGELTKSLSSVKKLHGAINWPDNLGTPPLLEKLNQTKHHLEDKLDQLRAQEKQLIKQLGTTLDQLEKNTEDGHVKKAKSLRKQAENTLQKLPPKIANQYQAKIQRLTHALNDLNDWQGYATNPKKQALVEKMQALVNDKSDLETRAKKIKQLQQEWKQLGGGSQSSNELWEQFQAASDAAYAPCKEHYQHKADIRQENLEKRKNLCAELESFDAKAHFDNLGFKELDEIQQKAWAEWKSHTPVNRKDSDKIFERFQAALKPIREACKTRIDEGVKQRKAIIADTEAAKSLDNRQATEQAKQAQQAWKQCAAIPRNMDQKLWRDFRQHCDEIFQQRDELRQERKTELDQHKQSAETLLSEFKQQLASLSDEADIRKQLGDLQKAWHKLGPLPRSSSRDLEREFSDLTHQTQNKLRTLSFQTVMDAFNQQLQQAKQLTELEQQSLEGQWQTIEAGEENNQRQQAVTKAHQSQQAVSMNEALLEEHLRKVIDIEILAGVESPSEDQNLRMEQQVARLNETMGQQNTDHKLQEAIDLCQACFELPAFDPTTRSTHEQRLENAIRHLHDAEVNR